jgi:hypothetical protein
VIPKANNPNWKFRQEMELWYPGDKSLKVEVFAPVRNEQGEISISLLGSCGLGETKSEGSDTVPIWIIRNHQAEPEIDKDENYIHFLVDNRVDDFVGGERILKIHLEGSDSGDDVPVKFHAWIERNLGRPNTEFADNTEEDRSFTINAIANATLPLVVGAFSPSTSHATYSPTYLSSSGPSLNPLAENKPELSAPGENISCAQALVTDRADLTGTSAAAPHVTGVIALMFQQALNLPQPRLLHIREIRDILIATADRNAAIDTNGYHRQLGYGRVNAVKALKRIVPR